MFERRISRLGDEDERTQDCDRADREVDVEDPLPVEPLHDEAAGERPGRECDCRDEAQIPIAMPPLPRRERDADDRERGGLISAAPTPWTTRAAMTTPGAHDKPQTSDDNVKIASPVKKMARRPYRSASLPPTRVAPPNVSR